jgi:hypothetical protein
MMMQLCATNVKVRKQTLLLLAKADRKLQQEKKYHESQGHAFVPSAVQQQNERLWAEAKLTMPEAAAEAEGTAPQRRERFSDIFKSQMEMQQKLVQQYTQPNNVDTALLTMLASFTNAVAAQPVQVVPSAPQATFSKKQRLAELKELLDDGTITRDEYDKARMLLLTN